MATERPIRTILAAALALALLAGCSSDGDDASSTTTAASDTDASGDTGGGAASGCVDTADGAAGEAADIVSVVEGAIDDLGLGGALVSVRRGGDEVVTAARGQTIPGVDATADMRFWNGAAVFSYLGTAMVQLDAEGVLDLDEPIATWLPDAPAADQITPRMLVSTTSGYLDYVPMQDWIDDVYADPFTPFDLERLEGYVFDEPLLYEPGTNVSYSHLNFQLAGAIVEEATGEPLADVLAARILEPLGLDDTETVDTAQIPGPILRTFSPERGTYEETSSWSPAWGVPAGATLATTVCDLAVGAAGIGSGKLLDDEGYAFLLDPGTADLGEPTDECPQCIPQTPDRRFGFGVIIAGDWIIQTPQFTGIAGVQAYLPDEDLAIGVANTYGPDADIDSNPSTQIFTELAALLAPDAALPEL